MCVLFANGLSSIEQQSRFALLINNELPDTVEYPDTRFFVVGEVSK